MKTEQATASVLLPLSVKVTVHSGGLLQPAPSEDATQLFEKGNSSRDDHYTPKHEKDCLSYNPESHPLYVQHSALPEPFCGSPEAERYLILSVLTHRMLPDSSSYLTSP